MTVWRRRRCGRNDHNAWRCATTVYHIRDDFSASKQVDHPGYGFFQRQHSGFQCQLGIMWLLIGRGYPSKVLDFPLSCQPVEPFYIPPLAYVQRAVAIDFQKLPLKHNVRTRSRSERKGEIKAVSAVTPASRNSFVISPIRRIFSARSSAEKPRSERCAHVIVAGAK